MARHVDFDADWERYARSQSGPTMKVYGVEHQLPVSVPVALTLLRWRLVTDPTSVLLPQVLDVLRLLFGDTVDEWITRGIERQRLYHLVLTVSALWDPDPEETAEGEAQPPETGDAPSSPTS